MAVAEAEAVAVAGTEAEADGEAEGEAVAVPVGRPEGVGTVPSPALQEVLLIRQLPGSAWAAPVPWAT